MRPHSAFSLMFLLLLAMLLGLGPVIAGRAQEATPEATPTALAWSACADADGWECATLPVPLDYADPTGPTIDLALTRLPAGDPARRIGALVVNCGGPGCPTVTHPAPVGRAALPGGDPRPVRPRRLRPPRRRGERPDRLPARLRGLLRARPLPRRRRRAGGLARWRARLRRGLRGQRR